jgi:hypothetical protein
MKNKLSCACNRERIFERENVMERNLRKNCFVDVLNSFKKCLTNFQQKI